MRTPGARCSVQGLSTTGFNPQQERMFVNFDNATYCFLDTETTSAESTRGVCEVGWIITDDQFNILDTVEALIDPEQMISPSASGIHGLVNADVENSPTLSEFFSSDDPSCYGRKLPGDLVMLGHRISFDRETIGPYVDGDIQEACSLRWARRVYPEADDHKLSTLIYALGLPRSAGAHRVLADVMSAYHLTKHICDRTGLTLRQYAEASQEPFLVPVMPMGKHKGEPISEVPKSYLRWMLGNMDLDFDLKFSVESALNNNNKKSL